MVLIPATVCFESNMTGNCNYPFEPGILSYSPGSPKSLIVMHSAQSTLKYNRALVWQHENLRSHTWLLAR